MLQPSSLPVAQKADAFTNPTLTDGLGTYASDQCGNDVCLLTDLFHKGDPFVNASLVEVQGLQREYDRWVGYRERVCLFLNRHSLLLAFINDSVDARCLVWKQSDFSESVWGQGISLSELLLYRLGLQST